jgi:hypothetical protein
MIGPFSLGWVEVTKKRAECQGKSSRDEINARAYLLHPLKIVQKQSSWPDGMEGVHAKVTFLVIFSKNACHPCCIGTIIAFQNAVLI